MTAPVIQPLSIDDQQRVIEKTDHYISLAETLFEIKAIPVDINFNLKGRSAGMYRVSQTGRFRRLPGTGKQKREIRYNSFIFSKYFEDNVNTTIPHEVAHYVSDIIYGLKNIRPHGIEWKEIMMAFDADATVTADYDLTGIPLKKQTSYPYKCHCREHQLGSIRHNRVNKKRVKYYCNYCKQVLRPVDQ